MNKFLIAIIISVLTSLASAKTVDFVVPYAPGGTADRMAITILPFLKNELAEHDLVPVLTYRPGAGSVLGSATVAKSSPDKLQLLLVGNSVVTAPIINPSAAGYDISTDFLILDYLGHIPMLLVVNANSSIKSIDDFKKQCRQTSMSYGSSGIGSVTHIASAMVSDLLQCKSTHVPYKGLGQAITDLQGGHINFVSDFTASIGPHIESGMFRAILSVDRQRLPSYPKIPSMADIGDKDYNFYNWFVLMTNANANTADLSKVRSAVKRLSTNSELQRQLQTIGLQGSNIAWDQQFLVREHTNFTRILKGIQK
jgi:tripartite-type tricarboxylate transporter receptor subunit TctC